MTPSTLLALTLSILPSFTRAYTQDAAYDAGSYGHTPTRTYISTDITSPQLNILKHDPACEDGLYTFFTPRGNSGYANPGAAILDDKGELVWYVGGYDQIYNLMAQEWNGKQYLTFWAGNDAVGGHGAGFYYMLDDSYNQIAKIAAANNLDGDLHDFRFTPDGTALITVYEIITKEVNWPEGTSDTVIWDCLIQEISLEDGSLIFQWRASDHYDVQTTYRPLGQDGTSRRPFDFFHLNSVEKDADGNFLISSRYMKSITYISGATGEILWVLGGKRNAFVWGQGLAGGFHYQHDARWLDATTITLFDNGAEDGHPIEPFSRGLKIRLDFQAMTAVLVGQYVNPHNITGVSQGSMQVLRSTDVVVGYGNAAAWTQFAANGTVLCDVHFGPESQFGAGRIQSYRVYKFGWRGYPDTRPDIRVVSAEGKGSGNETEVYISWNGDTEVQRWVVQTAEVQEDIYGAWEEVLIAQRTGFETRIVLRDFEGRYLRVFGLDSRGNMLGVSGTAYEVGREDGFWRFDFGTSSLDFMSGNQKRLAAVLVAVMGVLGIRGALVWRARRAWRRGFSLVGKEEGEGERLD